MMRLFLICASAGILAACGEFDQAQTAERHLPDAAPWKGVKNVYAEKGWTPGDEAAWNTQMRTRAQHQNEYLKVN